MFTGEFNSLFGQKNVSGDIIAAARNACGDKVAVDHADLAAGKAVEISVVVAFTVADAVAALVVYGFSSS